MKPISFFSAAPAAAGIVVTPPTVASIANSLNRRFAAGLFAVHSIVGVQAPHRAALASPVDQSAVVAQVRTPIPRVRSFVGQRFMPTHLVITDPTVASVRTPLPRTATVVGKAPHLAVTPAQTSKAKPVTAFTRTPFPRIDSTVGLPRPQVAAPAAPAQSKARAVVQTIRSLVPRTRSTVGAPRPQIIAPAPSRARAVVATIRSLIPRTRSAIGTARAGIKSAVTAQIRPQPRTALVRIAAPRVRSTVLAALHVPIPVTHLDLAIGRSDATDALSPSAVATTAIQQNASTTKLAQADSQTTALAWQNVATTPLDPTD